MTMALAVFLDQKYLGEVTFEGAADRYGLTYSPAWLVDGGFPISPHLKPEECRPESVRRFLANLLPEGMWLEELSLTTHVSKSNIFGLIAALGSETTGALTFRLGGDSLKPLPTSFRAVSANELTERILGRQEQSITVWDGKPRLSVAGVQEKLPILVMPDGSIGFGEGDLASTHILKFGKAREMHLVVNEYICMELARRVRLPVAEVSLVRFGEPVLMVKRFDRQWSDGKRVDRLHLIDGCQMLDLSPTYKYERPFGKGGDAAVIRDGASLPKLFSACHMCRIPAAALRDMLNWVLFQLLIGNSDAHGKNISFFVGAGGIDVAPAYDLLNLDIYSATYERDFAMAVGDAFDPDDLSPWQLAEMCADCGLPQRQVAHTFSALCETMLRCLDTIDFFDNFTEDEKVFAAALVSRLRENAHSFMGMARELKRVTL